MIDSVSQTPQNRDIWGCLMGECGESMNHVYMYYVLCRILRALLLLMLRRKALKRAILDIASLVA